MKDFSTFNLGLALVIEIWLPSNHPTLRILTRSIFPYSVVASNIIKSKRPNLGAYYPRGHGLITNILSLLGNGRLFFRCQISAVNWGRSILSNNNNLLPTCKFY